MNHNKYIELNPDFITSLTDAEGCFSVNVLKDNRAKNTRNITQGFTIKMLYNEAELLCMVKSYFNCGNM